MRALVLAAAFDFGYTWPWTHGHLVVALAAAAGAALAWIRFKAARTGVLLTLVAVWAFAAFLVVQFGFRLNDPVALSAPRFLENGSGRVLDLGSGSGRATLAVLIERPRARVVALDNWSADYIEENSPRRLLANAEAAGVADRVEVTTADMRSLPFEANTFDGIISTYAIDHLNREGRTRALAEAFRVLKPGGTFLVMVINADRWLFFLYGPLLQMHGFRDVQEAWHGFLTGAGFEVLEQDRRTGTAYFLVRKP